MMYHYKYARKFPPCAKVYCNNKQLQTIKRQKIGSTDRFFHLPTRDPPKPRNLPSIAKLTPHTASTCGTTPPYRKRQHYSFHHRRSVHSSNTTMSDAATFYSDEKNLKKLCDFLRSSDGPAVREAIEMDKRVYYLKGETTTVNHVICACLHPSIRFILTMFLHLLFVHLQVKSL